MYFMIDSVLTFPTETLQSVVRKPVVEAQRDTRTSAPSDTTVKQDVQERALGDLALVQQ